MSTIDNDIDRHEDHLGATAAIKRILEQLDTQARASQGVNRPAETPVEDADPADPAAPETITSLGAVVDALDDRAFGILMLILALPCCVPFIYVLPQIVAVPILLLAGQMMRGYTAPRLPSKLRARTFPMAPLHKSVAKAEKYLGWFEHFSKPRLRFLTEGIGARIVGLLMLVPAASILIPLPSTNTVPGIGVTLVSVGIIERDGLLVLLGLAIGLAWVALLAFILIVFGVQALEHIREVLMPAE